MNSVTLPFFYIFSFIIFYAGQFKTKSLLFLFLILSGMKIKWRENYKKKVQAAYKFSSLESWTVHFNFILSYIYFVENGQFINDSKVGEWRLASGWHSLRVHSLLDGHSSVFYLLVFLIEMSIQVNDVPSWAFPYLFCDISPHYLDTE